MTLLPVSLCLRTWGCSVDSPRAPSPIQLSCAPLLAKLQHQHPVCGGRVTVSRKFPYLSNGFALTPLPLDIIFPAPFPWCTAADLPCYSLPSCYFLASICCRLSLASFLQMDEICYQNLCVCVSWYKRSSMTIYMPWVLSSWRLKFMHAATGYSNPKRTLTGSDSSSFWMNLGIKGFPGSQACFKW